MVLFEMLKALHQMLCSMVANELTEVLSRTSIRVPQTLWICCVGCANSMNGYFSGHFAQSCSQ